MTFNTNLVLEEKGQDLGLTQLEEKEGWGSHLQITPFLTELGQNECTVKQQQVLNRFQSGTLFSPGDVWFDILNECEIE